MSQAVLLGDIVTHFKGLAFKSADYRPSGVPIIKVSNFTTDSVDVSNLDYVPEEIARVCQSVLLKRDDIVIATVGSWPNNPASVVGKTIRIPGAAESALLNQNAVAIRHKSADPIEQQYLYYSLRSPEFIDYLMSGAQGSANQASITLKSIFRYKINSVDYSLKKSVVEILSSIDKKIEVNQRMNETLEQMGQALFCHYFSANPKAQEWPRVKLKDVVTNIKEPLKAGGHLSDRIYLPIERLKMKSLSIHEPLSYSDARSSLIGFEKNDILVGAMRVYFHRVNVAPAKGVTRTTTFVLRPNVENMRAFATFLINQDATVSYANTHSKGTTMPYATWDNGLGDMQISLPPNDVLNEFSVIVWPIIEKIRDSYQGIASLTTLRDTLLPRLISGKAMVA